MIKPQIALMTYEAALLAPVQAMMSYKARAGQEKYLMANLAALNGVVAGGKQEDRVTPNLPEGGLRIEVKGSTSNSESFWSFMDGATSYGRLREKAYEAAMSPSVKYVVLNFDSPGGAVAGLADFQSAIQFLSRTKPVYAYTSGDMCSAAYYAALAANEIFAADLASVGSIGAVAIHFDWRKAMEMDGVEATVFRAGDLKGTPNPYEALTPAVRAEVQKGLDTVENLFLAWVSERRGLTGAGLSAAAEGRIFHADEALSLGMIDAVTTWEGMIDKVVSQLQSAGQVKYSSSSTGLSKMESRPMTVKTESIPPVSPIQGGVGEVQATGTVPDADVQATGDLQTPDGTVLTTLEATLPTVDTSAQAGVILALTQKMSDLQTELAAVRASSEKASELLPAMRAVLESRIVDLEAKLGFRPASLGSLSLEQLISEEKTLASKFAETFKPGQHTGEGAPVRHAQAVHATVDTSRNQAARFKK
jgi:signal peptide peptidase SppA